MTDANPHIHTLDVVEVIRETDHAVSIVFGVPPAKTSRFRYRPGQFLTLEIPSDREGSVARCYSLSSSPYLDDHLIVTVKRTTDGYASNWLCDNADVGMSLRVLTPSGVFVPKDLSDNLLLLAAGSGITPLMSIAKSALLAGTGAVQLFYANTNPAAVIFGAEIDEMMVEFPDRLTVTHWLESESGLPTVEAIAQATVSCSSFHGFICGPPAFMDAATAALNSIGMPPHHIHHEKFQSLTGDPFADISIDAGDGPVTKATVELAGNTHEIEWPRNTPLLDVLLSKGLDAPFSCRAGECSACACVVRRGNVRLLKNDTLVEADIAMGVTLACQALPISDHVSVAFE